jgi:hypothetical protein
VSIHFPLCPRTLPTAGTKKPESYGNIPGPRIC